MRSSIGLVTCSGLQELRWHIELGQSAANSLPVPPPSGVYAHIATRVLITSRRVKVRAQLLQSLDLAGPGGRLIWRSGGETIDDVHRLDHLGNKAIIKNIHWNRNKMPFLLDVTRRLPKLVLNIKFTEHPLAGAPGNTREKPCRNLLRLCTATSLRRALFVITQRRSPIGLGPDFAHGQ